MLVSWSHYCISSAILPPFILLFSFVFKDNSSFLSFPHISRIEACQCHPDIVYVVLTPCWAHYWFLEVARLHLGCWMLAPKPFVFPSSRHFSASAYAKAFRLYIYFQEWNLKSPSLPIREGNLLLAAEPLPNYSDYCWWNGCATWWLVIWPIIPNEAPQREG